MSQPPSTARAEVRIEATSEPASGSVIPSAPIFSPAIAGTSQRVRRELAFEEAADRRPELGVLVGEGRHGGCLVVLHYDSDFDLISSVTDQPVEWVVPRGTVD
jgi:hypothetical protein